MAFLDDIKSSAQLLQLAVAETLWPTRCAVCDTPGELLCARCRLHLPYIDQLLACPVCGAAYGRRACTECNHMILKWKGLARFPLDGCASAVMLTPETRRIVVAYKDRGDQGLARVIAALQARIIPPAWLTGAALVPIPARRQALRTRGFDHVGLITRELSALTDLPICEALAPGKQKDQRELDARERLTNMRGAISVAPIKKNALEGSASSVIAPLPSRVILVDDVLTTGATLFAAAEALREAGVREVFALTFARV